MSASYRRAAEAEYNAATQGQGTAPQRAPRPLRGAQCICRLRLGETESCKTRNVAGARLRYKGRHSAHSARGYRTANRCESANRHDGNRQAHREAAADNRYYRGGLNRVAVSRATAIEWTTEIGATCEAGFRLSCEISLRAPVKLASHIP